MIIPYMNYNLKSTQNNIIYNKNIDGIRQTNNSNFTMFCNDDDI